MNLEDVIKLVPLLLMLALWFGKRRRRRDPSPDGTPRRARRIPRTESPEFKRDYEPIEPRSW